jgi:hypothetical protein
LRTALDHLIYAVAKYETRDQLAPDIEKMSFIIVDSPALFMDRNNRRRLSGLSQAVIDAVESVQPYKRGHSFFPPLLRILREFSNGDKHRLLKPAAAAVSLLDLIILSDPTKGKKVGLIKPEPIKNNDIVCVAESDEPDTQFALNSIKAGIEIALWHGLRDGDTNPLNARTGYSVLLPRLLSEVRFIVDQVRAAVV